MSCITREPKLPFVLITLFVAVWQGMIGVFVKWVSWPPAAMVCARCAIASIGLWALAWAIEAKHPTSRREEAGPGVPVVTPTRTPATPWGIVLGGVLLAGHWGALFWAYRVAEVGPVVVSVFTFPIMASLTEPWFFGARPCLRQVLLAGLVVVGVATMVHGRTDTAAGSDGNGWGILLGLVSAAFIAARNILSRRQLAGVHPIRLMAQQTLVVAVLTAPSLAWVGIEDLTTRNVALLAILGIGFTALSHTLMMWTLKHLSVAATGIIGSLQVVAGILLARWLLSEVTSLTVWLGAGTVLVAVAIESWAMRKAQSPGLPSSSG